MLSASASAATQHEEVDAFHQLWSTWQFYASVHPHGIRTTGNPLEFPIVSLWLTSIIFQTNPTLFPVCQWNTHDLPTISPWNWCKYTAPKLSTLIYIYRTICPLSSLNLYVWVAMMFSWPLPSHGQPRNGMVTGHERLSRRLGWMDWYPAILRID